MIIGDIFVIVLRVYLIIFGSFVFIEPECVQPNILECDVVVFEKVM